MYMVVIFRTRYVGRSCAYLDSCADDLYRYISISREKNQDVHLSVLVRVGGKKQLMRSRVFSRLVYVRVFYVNGTGAGAGMT